MRPVVITLTGTGSTLNSTPVRMDWRGSPFNVGLGFADTGTTTGFTVQYTFDDPTGFASASAWNTNGTWYNHAFMAAMKAASSGNIAFPVQGVRMQADASGTDTGTLTIIQGTSNG